MTTAIIEPKAAFDYGALIPEDADALRGAEKAYRKAEKAGVKAALEAAAAVAAGRKACPTKEIFELWCREVIGCRLTTAYGLIAIDRRLADRELGDVDFSGLMLLASSGTPEEVVEKVAARSLEAPVSHAEVKAAVAEAKAKEPPARKEPPKRQPPVKDGTGAKVPRHLKDVFGDTTVADAAAAMAAWVDRLKADRMLSALAARAGDVPWLKFDALQKALIRAADQMQAAAEIAQQAAPYAVCTACGGAGCGECMSCGWVPLWRHEEMAAPASE